MASMKHFIDQVIGRADCGDHAWSTSIRQLDLDLQIDTEDKALRALGGDRLDLSVKVLDHRDALGLGTERTNRMIGGARRFLPDSALARPEEGAELEFSSGGVPRRQAYIALDHRYLALLSNQHWHGFDAHEKGVQGVGAIHGRGPCWRPIEPRDQGRPDDPDPGNGGWPALFSRN